jgi:hypothetical protein
MRCGNMFEVSNEEGAEERRRGKGQNARRNEGGQALMEEELARGETGRVGCAQEGRAAAATCRHASVWWLPYAHASTSRYNVSSQSRFSLLPLSSGGRPLRVHGLGQQLPHRPARKVSAGPEGPAQSGCQQAGPTARKGLALASHARARASVPFRLFSARPQPPPQPGLLPSRHHAAHVPGRRQQLHAGLPARGAQGTWA